MKGNVIRTPVRYDRDFTIIESGNTLIADVLVPVTNDNHELCHQRGEYIAKCINEHESQISRLNEAENVIANFIKTGFITEAVTYFEKYYPTLRRVPLKTNIV